MTDTANEKNDRALDGIAAVAPPEDSATDTADAAAEKAKADADRKLDEELEESFPSSDAPSATRPGTDEPAPSSGFDENAN